MKIATYFILVVATICVLIAAVSVVMAAIQVVIYIAATVFVVWLFTQIAIFMNKKLVKQPPP